MSAFPYKYIQLSQPRTPNAVFDWPWYSVNVYKNLILCKEFGFPMRRISIWTDNICEYKNARFWVTEKSHVVLPNVHIWQELLYGMQLSPYGIFSPILNDQNVTNDRYQRIFMNNFVSLLYGMIFLLKDDGFSKMSQASQNQPGVPGWSPAKPCGSRDYPEVYDKGKEWPPMSPSLTSYDFYLWNYGVSEQPTSNFRSSTNHWN